LKLKKHVFISYVHEDISQVLLIKAALEFAGISVWLDIDSLAPGGRWKEQIRKAINEGAFCIACFSANYLKKQSSYMNEELTLAIEQLRLRPHNRTWFIPVKLSDCEIPDWPIGAGATLRDLQWVDVSVDLQAGVNKLASVLVPAIAPYYLLIQQLPSLIHNKIRHFHEVGAQRFKQIEDRQWFPGF
jgi:hypothetical protein